MNHPHPIPSTRLCPDPGHMEDLSRLGDEITELSAHLDAGEFQFLHLIGIFDDEPMCMQTTVCVSSHAVKKGSQ